MTKTVGIQGVEETFPPRIRPKYADSLREETRSPAESPVKPGGKMVVVVVVVAVVVAAGGASER